MTNESDAANGVDDCVVASYEVRGATVVTVTGVVDAFTAPRLRDAVDVALESFPLLLVVDLLGVEFLSSAGMSVLIAAHQAAGSRTGVSVVADGAATSRPMKLIGIADTVPLYRTLDEAIDALTA